MTLISCVPFQLVAHRSQAEPLPEKIAEADPVGHPQHLMDPGTSQVGIQQQDVFTGLGDDGRQIGGHGGLSLRRDPGW